MAPGIMGGEEKNDLLPPWRSRPSRRQARTGIRTGIRTGLPVCIPPRRRSALAIFILVALFFFFLKPDALPFGFGRNRPDRPGLQYAPACANAVDHLRKPSYKLTRDIIYQKRCIRPTIDRKVDRTALTSIAEPLVGEGQLLHLDKSCAGWQQPKCEPIRLRVPPAYPMMDYSHLIFGVATSLERLTESMFQFESWIADSGASLLAIITDAKPKGDAKEDAAFEKVTRQFRARGIDITIRRPWNTTATQNEQHFTIIRDLRRAATRDTKWVAIVDDDTFFPSLYPLAEILDKYDHTVPAYLGALSDNGDAVKHHGFMAFGGAGIFLSLSLLNELDPHIEACLGEEHVPQGDGLLRACIYGKTKTELTVIKGLHQLDMGHDLSGLYESGTLPISLHHWKSWHHSPVDEMVKISEFCGSCFLQRFQFGSDTILSNGFSIAMYPEGTKSVNLTEMEGTFDGYPGFEWSLGPMRSPLDRFHKKSYRLVESEKLGRNLRQIFVHRVEDDLPTMGEIEAAGGVNNVKLPKISKMRDEVVELWWEW